MKKIIFVTLIYLYIFIIIGLLLHTSSNTQILSKYSYKNFILIITLFILFIPYLKFLSFLFGSTNIKIKKKRLVITPFNKIVLLVLFIIFFLIFPIEVYLRSKNIRYDTNTISLSKGNFHPFLQNQNIPSDNYKFRDLKINNFGFRGEKMQRKKSKDTIRIFFLGGSTVLNKYTPYEKNSARLLEKKLNNYYKDSKFEIFNAGTEYYTTEHSLIQYMFKIKDFEPDLIILWQGANDMAASCINNSDTFGTYQPDYSHRLGPLQRIFNYYYSPSPIIELISFKFVQDYLQHSLYSDIRDILSKKDNTISKPFGKPIEYEFKSIQSYKRNLQYFIKISKIDDLKVILANQPYLYNNDIDKKHRWDLENVCLKNHTYPSIHSLISGIKNFNKVTKEVADQNSIPFVDLESKIPKTLDYFSDDFHFYSEKSNEIVANELFNFILSRNLINDLQDGN